MYSFKGNRRPQRYAQREERKPVEKVKRGDVFYVYKSPSASSVGSETYAARPGIVVSNNNLNCNSDVVEIVYLTTTPKTDMLTHVEIKSLARKSIALCEQINTVDKTRLGDKYGMVTVDEMRRIDEALKESLGIEVGASILENESSVVVQRDMYKKLYEDLLDRVTRKEN